MNTEEMKKWIDNASYEELLRHWRFAPVGDPFFRDEVGDYYSAKMAEKRDQIGHEEAVRVSKHLGFTPLQPE